MDRLYICIHIDKIYVWIVTHNFLHSCTRVMALGLRQIFGSIQYLENKWTEFHQILYMQISPPFLQDLHWDATHHFGTFVPELWPLI